MTKPEKIITGCMDRGNFYEYYFSSPVVSSVFVSKDATQILLTTQDMILDSAKMREVMTPMLVEIANNLSKRFNGANHTELSDSDVIDGATNGQDVFANRPGSMTVGVLTLSRLSYNGMTHFQISNQKFESPFALFKALAEEIAKSKYPLWTDSSRTILSQKDIEDAMSMSATTQVIPNPFIAAARPSLAIDKTKNPLIKS